MMGWEEEGFIKRFPSYFQEAQRDCKGEYFSNKNNICLRKLFTIKFLS